MTGPMSTLRSPSVGPTFIFGRFDQALDQRIAGILPTGTATLPAMQRSPAQPKAEA